MSSFITVLGFSFGVSASLILASPLGAQPQAQASAPPTAATAKAPASSDAAPELAAMLAMPVSRASIAMLVAYPIQPAALQRLSDALQDPQPDVRAVAARVAFASRSATLVGVLARALRSEQDPVAVREELRALALIGNSTTDAIALEVAAGRGLQARLEFLIAFARSRPADFGAHLAALFTPEDQAVRIMAPLAATLPPDGAWLTPLFTRASERFEWWSALLDGLDAKHARFGEAIAIGVRSPDERIRAVTVWHVAALLASGRELPADLVKPVDERAPQAAPGSVEAFAFDLLGRVRKQKRAADWREPLRNHEEWLGKGWQRSTELAPFLTNAEHDAWSMSATGHKESKPDDPDDLLKALKLLGPFRRTRTLPASTAPC
jgi:hypothetical protein